MMHNPNYIQLLKQAAEQLAKPQKREERKNYVPKACIHCKQSHVACEKERPCKRCIRLGKQDTCVDAERKRRGRPTNVNREKKDLNPPEMDYQLLQLMNQSMIPTEEFMNALQALSLLIPFNNGEPDLQFLEQLKQHAHVQQDDQVIKAMEQLQHGNTDIFKMIQQLNTNQMDFMGDPMLTSAMISNQIIANSNQEQEGLLPMDNLLPIVQGGSLTHAVDSKLVGNVNDSVETPDVSSYLPQ